MADWSNADVALEVKALLSGRAWNGGPSEAVVLAYYFAEAGGLPGYYDDPDLQVFAGTATSFDAVQRAAAVTALQAWASVANLKFVEAASADEAEIVGKAACREWAKRLDGVSMELSTQSEEIVVSGDWAFERFVEIQVITAENGTKSQPHFLQCMWTLRRKADNSWEILHFIWNDNPSPEA